MVKYIVNDIKSRMPRIGLVIQGMTDGPPASWPPDSQLQQYCYLAMRNGFRLSSTVPTYRLARRNSSLKKYLVQKRVSRKRATKLRERILGDLDVVERRLDELSRETAISEEQVRGIDERLAAASEKIIASMKTKSGCWDQRRAGKAQDCNGCSAPACMDNQLRTCCCRSESALSPMSIEENMAFLRDQTATFREMREDALRVTEAKKQVVFATQSRIDDLRSLLRCSEGDASLGRRNAVRCSNSRAASGGVATVGS